MMHIKVILHVHKAMSWAANRLWGPEVLGYKVELGGGIGSVLSSDQNQIEH